MTTTTDEKVKSAEEPVVGRWRVAQHFGRTIYLDDKLVGMLDTEELARAAVEKMNYSESEALDREKAKRGHEIEARMKAEERIAELESQLAEVRERDAIRATEFSQLSDSFIAEQNAHAVAKAIVADQLGVLTPLRSKLRELAGFLGLHESVTLENVLVAIGESLRAAQSQQMHAGDSVVGIFDQCAKGTDGGAKWGCTKRRGHTGGCDHGPAVPAVAETAEKPKPADDAPTDDCGPWCGKARIGKVYQPTGRDGERSCVECGKVHRFAKEAPPPATAPVERLTREEIAEGRAALAGMERVALRSDWTPERQRAMNFMWKNIERLLAAAERDLAQHEKEQGR